MVFTGVLWSSEHHNALVKHLDAKMSFAGAAAALNLEFGTSYTRNAVIGRAGRNGLCSSVPKSQGSKLQARYHGGERRKAAPKAKPAPKPVVFQCEAATGLRIADVVPRNLSLIDLEAGDCRWPYGEGPFVFCGCPKFGDASYCEPHRSLSVGRGTVSEQRAHQRMTA